jgi:hypothetical protein
MQRREHFCYEIQRTNKLQRIIYLLAFLLYQSEVAFCELKVYMHVGCEANGTLSYRLSGIMSQAFLIKMIRKRLAPHKIVENNAECKIIGALVF